MVITQSRRNDALSLMSAESAFKARWDVHSLETHFHPAAHATVGRCASKYTLILCFCRRDIWSPEALPNPSFFHGKTLRYSRKRRRERETLRDKSFMTELKLCPPKRQETEDKASGRR